MNTERAIKPSETSEIIEHLITEGAKNLVADWNKANPEDPIDFRFIKTKGEIKGNAQIRAQACLTLEVRRNLKWNVLSRKVANFQSKAGMEKHEGLYELELWSAMFVEILNMGLFSALSIIQFRTETKQQTNERTKQEYPATPDQAVGKAHSPKTKSPRKTSTKRS